MATYVPGRIRSTIVRSNVSNGRTQSGGPITPPPGGSVLLPGLGYWDDAIVWDDATSWLD